MAIGLAFVVAVDLVVAWMCWVYVAFPLAMAQLLILSLGVAMIRNIVTHTSVPLRIVHGLEHATVALLARRGIYVRSAHSHDRYFVLDHSLEKIGLAELVDAVRHATELAIQKIRDGEYALAYHARCGGRLVIIAMLALGIGTTALVAAMCASGHVAVGLAAVLGVLVFLAAPRATTCFQRRFSVSPRFGSASVLDVDALVVPGVPVPAVQVGVLLEVDPRAST